MRRFTSTVAIGALVLGSVGLFAGAASATTPTLTLTPTSAVAVNGTPFTLTATASEAGTVAFTANSVAISGCATEAAQGSGTSFIAICPWTPALTLVSPVSIGASFTATVVADGGANATAISVTTDSVSLTGAAVYSGQNAKFTATTYSAGTVAFSQDATPLSGCASVSSALNANSTAYVATCTLTADTASDTVTATFTPTSGANAGGLATYNEVVNTLLLSGGTGAIVSVSSTLTADAYETGTVTFSTLDISDVATPISTCTNVATSSVAAPFVFTCAYTPTASGASTVQATLTPVSDPMVGSNNLTVTASEIVLAGGAAIYSVSAGTIEAMTGEAGTVTFYVSVNGTPTAITGCSNVATLGSSAPYTTLCTWTPSAAGAFTLSATITPGSGPSATSANFADTVGTPIQGQQYPISMYVDTILATGASGSIAPEVGAGCEITNEFLVGQTIVFRVYGNDAQLKGAALSPANVATATVTIAGFAGSPITMTYGSHGGEAFYVGVLATGTKAGQYDTLGVIPYTVTFTTNAVPAVKAVTKTVAVYKKELVNVKVGKKIVKKLRRVKVGTEVVVVTPAVAAIPGATGTYSSVFNPASQATLNAVPTDV